MLKEKFDDLFEKASPAQEMKWGKEIEKEHGTVSPSTNITDDDPVMTAKIAKAHVNEIPDYYTRLRELEKQGKAALKDKLELAMDEKLAESRKPLFDVYKVFNNEVWSQVEGEENAKAEVKRLSRQHKGAEFRYKRYKRYEESLSERILGEKEGPWGEERIEDITGYSAKAKPCVGCDGKGYLEDRDETGRYQIECPVCKGKKVEPEELTEVSASPDAIKRTYQDMKGKYFTQSDAIKATANWYKTNTDYIKKIVTTMNEQNMSFNDVYHTCLNLSKDKHGAVSPSKAIEQALSLWTGGKFDALESGPRQNMIKKALAQIEEMPLEATHGEVPFDTFDKTLDARNSLYEVELLDTFESKLESALEEDRYVTYASKLLYDIKLEGLKRLDAWSIADGVVGLYRYEFDKNAYEIEIRPIQTGKYKSLWGKRIK